MTDEYEKRIVDKTFSEMNQIELDFCELQNQRERQCYSKGYAQAMKDAVVSLKDISMDIGIKIGEELGKKLEIAQQRNYLDK